MPQYGILSSIKRSGPRSTVSLTILAGQFEASNDEEAADRFIEMEEPGVLIRLMNESARIATPAVRIRTA